MAGMFPYFSTPSRVLVIALVGGGARSGIIAGRPARSAHRRSRSPTH